ncbi:uncharacterized conserved protein [Anaerolinea thermolimosa]|uniref:TVP38/TMEM64 family protein n=1 Tax=Anaerolinea thermolimosa TaxID=229919 RepID=UPI000784C9B4|nr:VTT domain-containing protein [Anaerolinea thermolimosa]GAP05979.1 uncharacterized conserved protein [Anaerolinea thermolimosa]
MIENNEIQRLEGRGRYKVIRNLVFSLLIMAALAFLVSKDFTKIQDYIQQHAISGLFVAFLVYGILGASLIPSEPLTVLIGALFGPWIATLVATFGNILAALVEYYIGRKVGHATGFIENKHKLPLGLGKLPVDSPLFLILGRMVPGAGPKLVSFLGGVYHVPLGRYLWTTAIPTALGAAIFAFGGFGLASLFQTH